LSQRKGIKKIQRKFSILDFVMKSLSYQYFNFRNEFLGSKNAKKVVFIIKILQGTELLLKFKREK